MPIWFFPDVAVNVTRSLVAGDFVNSSSKTVTLGTGYSGRLFVVSAVGAIGLSTMTLNGNAMTSAIANSNDIIFVISDSTSTGSVTLSGNANFSYELYEVTGANSATAFATSSVNANNTTLNIPGTGAAFGLFTCNNGATGNTWTGLLKDTQDPTGTFSFASQDGLTTQTGRPISVVSSGAIFRLVVAVWGQ